MIKMKSERPLLINGAASTEFETNEQHAKELEASGLAQRLIEKEAAHADKSESKPKAKVK